METPDLAGWTPVAISLESPAPFVDWGDLRGIRFVEPYFDQTIERWAGGNPSPLIRTGLEALMALEPLCDPSGLIFHLPRSGSTLMSQLIATVPGMRVLAEPRPLNALLMASLDTHANEVSVAVLRALIRALGGRHGGDEGAYVLKLSSWNVRFITLFRRAFRGVPIVWLQRAPAETMASLLAETPGWAQLRHYPQTARKLFGVAEVRDASTFYLKALAAMLDAALAFGEGPMLTLDYRALPRGIWEIVAPFFGLTLNAGQIERMRGAAHFDSKSMHQRSFVTESMPILDAAMRAEIEDKLDPLYRAIVGRQTLAA